MNACEINKFINLAGAITMDCYQFNPVSEEVKVSKGRESIVIDLNISTEDQLSEFQTFMDGLPNG